MILILFPLLLLFFSYWIGHRFSFSLLLESLPLTKTAPEFVTIWEKSCTTYSEVFPTAPDLLFDYEKDGLPRELEDLKPEEFLEEPDKPNLVFLPKKDLTRTCEMLSPKEFLALSQTCRFLHWRMMKFCHCSVENLKIFVRCEGRRRSTGHPIFRIYPSMARHIYRKQLLFHNVQLYQVILPQPHDAYGLQYLVCLLRSRKNIKRLDFIQVIPHRFIPATEEGRRWETLGAILRTCSEKRNAYAGLFRDMDLASYHIEFYHPYKVDEGRHESYTCELGKLPHLTEGSSIHEKEVVVRSPIGHYLCVPPVILDKILKLFFGSDQHGILEYTCSFPTEHYQQVYSLVEKYWKWAMATGRIGLKCERYAGDSETFFFTFPGGRYQLVRVFEHCIYLVASRDVPLEQRF